MHNGKVSLSASIGRKGFAPGESITVHVVVDNQTNTGVTPRIALNQVQIYQCGIKLKVQDNSVDNANPVIGTAVGPGTQTEELLSVTISPNEALSIKSQLITVKYFVHVTLDIPHSVDLHLKLPVVVTSQLIIDNLHQDRLPEIVHK